MDQAEAIFSSQQSKRWAMSQMSIQERRDLLLNLKKVILKYRQEIKEALYEDFKKPFSETELTEIHPVLDEINFSVKNISKWARPKKVKTPLVLFGSKSYIKYEAKGVVLIIAPWNYPFALLLNPLVAAISAGNCVMAKPSEKTRATGLLLKKIVDEAFSPDMACVLLGELDLAEKLVSLPFDHIFFTGSTAVGKKIMAQASKNLTTLTLELGGKTPTIIDEDVDIADCAEKIFWGKFLNAGQTCVAPDYVFIAEKLKDKFIENFKMQIENRFGETSLERLKTQDFARIIDEVSYDRLIKKIENEKSISNDEAQRDQLFIPPTLLVDLDLKAPIMEEEIFGPILPLISYEKIEEAINYIQKNEKPLALYIFSKNKKIIKKILNNTTSGGVGINHVVLHLANPFLPFGGVGHSGMGSYHGEFGFRAFSHERSVLTQGFFSFSRFYFPPYNRLVSKIAFKILRWL